MAGCAECEGLYKYLVTGADTTGNQGKVYGGRTGRQCNDLLVERRLTFAMVDKIFEILLESIHIRAERHDPILVKRFLYKIHLPSGHMRQTEQNSFVHS